MAADAYKILGLARSASRQQIDAAYREKVKRYHPDKGGDAWAFERVQEAYELLSKIAATENAQPGGDNPAAETGEPRANEQPTNPSYKPIQPNPRPSQKPNASAGQRPLAHGRIARNSLVGGIVAAVFAVGVLYETDVPRPRFTTTQYKRDDHLRTSAGDPLQQQTSTSRDKSERTQSPVNAQHVKNTSETQQPDPQLRLQLQRESGLPRGLNVNDFGDGWSLYTSGNFAGAVESFSRAIASKIHPAASYCNRGLAKLRKGDIDGATSDFRSSIDINDRIADTWYYLAVALSEHAEPDMRGVWGCLNVAIRLSPRDPRPYRLRAKLDEVEFRQRLPQPQEPPAKEIR